MDRFEARRGPGLEQQMAQTAQADTQATLASALEAHQAGRREVAESLYRAVLADDPAEPTGLYLLGLLMFETGRPAQARGLFEQVVAARPDRAESHLALANLHHWLGDFALAIDGYRQALTVNPAHPGALVGLANALRDGGDAEAATIAARAAVAALPAEPTARLALGGALLAAGRAMEAARRWSRPSMCAGRRSWPCIVPARPSAPWNVWSPSIPVAPPAISISATPTRPCSAVRTPSGRSCGPWPSIRP
jgi:cytochrome c-type biogenesis protein CcmH/NrfG